ncbi:class IV adenylate cyclase [Thermoproteus tenax]|uniref:Adenylate cyclase n=1 Tax=Thermoproteus tenax (strain ATCC 35583 / DSM 2078 / JCM 9277 / NBRC 100435 / Kra 1) TaxID=768679 RepID=G4RLQ6_THETK|nr:class IV adenylate cyclase [Thermoproteus tenax]CCC82501.1 adenylate cyclase [Thermoproteus tenax Kra 1]
MLEVEAKFRADLSEVRGRLLKLGAVLLEKKTEIDVYYQHPCRDFAETDEALRVRYVDGAAEVTYKGPRLAASAKTRLELSASAEGEVDSILTALGFNKVASIKKTREYYSYRSFTISLDRVEGLGDFVEIEAVASSPDVVKSIEDEIAELAERLGLRERVESTYLELFLQRAR